MPEYQSTHCARLFAPIAPSPSTPCPAGLPQRNQMEAGVQRRQVHASTPCRAEVGRRLVLALASCVFLTLTASAQTWQTVDDFQYIAGKHAEALAIALDPAGNIFAAGAAMEPGTLTYGALVRKSADNGTTWSISDNVVVPYVAMYLRIASDSFGNLYAVGYDNPGGSTYWMASQSTDGGLSWNTVDLVPGYYFAESVATDAAGNVYVAGYVHPNGGSTFIWIVRKSSDMGATWTTVDSFNSNNNSAAYGVFCHPNGSVFVTGSAAIATKKGTTLFGATRRSTDGGATWTTVDTAVSGQGRTLGADASGNIYAAGSAWVLRKSTDNGNTWTTVDSVSGGIANGFAKDSSGNLFVVGGNGSSWLVRESVGGTGAWTMVDTYQLASSKAANARAVAADSAGHIYVAGVAADASGFNHWVVRKR